MLGAICGIEKKNKFAKRLNHNQIGDRAVAQEFFIKNICEYFKVVWIELNKVISFVLTLKQNYLK